MRAFHGWLLGALLLALGGCASTPQAGRTLDAEAKRFETHPGFAGIYVYRPDLGANTMEDTILYVDDRHIGQTLPGTFFRVDVQPGTRVVLGSAGVGSGIKIDARPGELYFVQLNVLSGTSPRLTLVKAEEARPAIVKCCVLLENWAPGQRPLLR
jgi:hypothetical protein